MELTSSSQVCYAEHMNIYVELAFAASIFIAVVVCLMGFMISFAQGPRNNLSWFNAVVRLLTMWFLFISMIFSGLWMERLINKF